MAASTIPCVSNKHQITTNNIQKSAGCQVFFSYFPPSLSSCSFTCLNAQRFGQAVHQRLLHLRVAFCVQATPVASTKGVQLHSCQQLGHLVVDGRWEIDNFFFQLFGDGFSSLSSIGFTSWMPSIIDIWSHGIIFHQPIGWLQPIRSTYARQIGISSKL